MSGYQAQTRTPKAGVNKATKTKTRPTVPKPGQIVFARYGDIYIINKDASGKNQLAIKRPPWGVAVAMSQDGRQFCFESTYAKALENPNPARSSQITSDIYLVKVGRSMKRLSDLKGASATDATFSRNGRQLAYCFFTGESAVESSQIWLINTETKTQTRLTKNANDREPSFSANDQRLTFVSGPAYVETGYRGDIYVINRDGSEQKQLTRTERQERTPKFSPDSKKIAFISHRDNLFGELYVMNADGTEQTRLTHNQQTDYSPVWSRDGTRIAFMSGSPDFPSIYTINADGSQLKRVITLSRGPIKLLGWM